MSENLADGKPRPGGVPEGFETLGLYTIHWPDQEHACECPNCDCVTLEPGGTSVAAIGMGQDGRLWLAATNWQAPSMEPEWYGIKVALIAKQGDQPT